MGNSNFSLHLSIDLNFRHTSKKIKGGSPKRILEKKNVFPKKYVELRTFDGILIIRSGVLLDDRKQKYYEDELPLGIFYNSYLYLLK
jgi:hypothetical protein